MSRREDTIDGIPVSFPRVSGDEPYAVRLCGSLTAFSPRERG